VARCFAEADDPLYRAALGENDGMDASAIESQGDFAFSP
jgi:hypothetical protein